MVYLSLPLIWLLDSLFLLCSHAQDQSPFQATASKKTYGPDGPWNAVSVQLGHPAQDIDLYPGGTFASTIFTNGLCKGVTAKPCGSGGLFTPEDSDSIDNTSIQLQTESTGVRGYWSDSAQGIDFSDASSIMDDLQLSPGGDTGSVVANLSIVMYSNVSIANPDGSTYPPQLGQMSLGAPNINQTFTRGGGEPAVNASLIPTYLGLHKVIPSASVGLHIGSAAFNLPLSLWFGGYDAARISGPVSTHSYADNPSNRFNLDLFDVGIGVDNGGSPFSYPKKDGLLASGNSSITNSIPIDMNLAAPYMNLPNSTCAAIAQELPVTYNAKYGLYFWNVEDPQYTKIVTSPTFLSFTFDNEFIVKVPFQLLNLTLDAPMIPTPTQYFPCQPPQDATSQVYSLGRAFLQAAFIGVDWASNGQWFLAQAPGPGVGTVPHQLPITSPSIAATPDDWASTWKSSWTPLPVTASSPEAPAARTSSGHHLSGGADAGIAIGAVAVVAIGLAIGYFLYRRRGSQSPSLSSLLPGHKDDKSDQRHDFAEGPPQYATAEEPQEMDIAPIRPSEPGGGDRRSELSGVERFEMQQPSRRGTSQ